MSPGPVLLKRFVRNKTDPYVDQVEHLNSNPTYANIKYSSGRESSVSVRDLAPCPEAELPPESSTMEPNKSSLVFPIQEEGTTSDEDVDGVRQLRRSEWTRNEQENLLIVMDGNTCNHFLSSFLKKWTLMYKKLWTVIFLGEKNILHTPWARMDKPKFFLFNRLLVLLFLQLYSVLLNKA